MDGVLASWHIGEGPARVMAAGAVIVKGYRPVGLLEAGDPRAAGTDDRVYLRHSPVALLKPGATRC